MARSPLDFEYGVNQGRIVPRSATIPDGAFVYCLGTDRRELRTEELRLGDYIQVQQSVDLTGVAFLTASIRTRQADGGPSTFNLGAGWEAQKGSVLNPGDTLNALIAPNAALILSPYMVQRQLVEISGSGVGNDGRYAVDGIVSPDTVILHEVLAASEAPGVWTVRTIGARWKLSLGVTVGLTTHERARIVHPTRRDGPTTPFFAEDDFYRADLQMHVSKIGGLRPVTFRMTLVEHAEDGVYAPPTVLP